MLADSRVCRILSKAILSGNIAKDPLVDVFDLVKHEPTAYDVNINELISQIRVREILWNVIQLHDPYTRFFKQAHHSAGISKMFIHQ